MNKMMKIMLRNLSICLIFALTCKAGNKQKYENALQYLKEKNYSFEPASNNQLTITTIEDKVVTEKDMQQICNLPEAGILFIKKSKIKPGAIKGLANCEQLERISYENTVINERDISDHGILKTLKNFDIEGNDQDLLAIAKLNLKKLNSIGISGDFTDEGIRTFIENIGHDVSGRRRNLTGAPSDYVEGLTITIVSPKITDIIFEYFINLKGLNKLYIGGVTGCQITEKAATKFGIAYMKKYNLKDTPMAYIWPDACPRE